MRKIIAFDAFGDSPRDGEDLDGDFIEGFEAKGGAGISVRELDKVFEMKGFNNYKLVKGNVISTIPAYVDQHPEMKISLQHIDVDVYGASKTILENLVDRVVKGKIIIFDNYGTVIGETKVVDEFFEGSDSLIKKLPFSHIPSLIIKDWILFKFPDTH